MALTHSAPVVAQTARLDIRGAVRSWLIAVAGLIFVMVLVGGATRPPDSGLSITQWKPVTGILPAAEQPRTGRPSSTATSTSRNSPSSIPT